MLVDKLATEILILKRYKQKLEVRLSHIKEKAQKALWYGKLTCVEKQIARLEILLEFNV